MTPGKTDQQMLDRLDKLISVGEQVLATHKGPSPGRIGGDPITLDTAMFAQWRAQCLALLNDFPGPDHSYTQSFEQQVHDPRRSETNRGLGDHARASGRRGSRLPDDYA